MIKLNWDENEFKKYKFISFKPEHILSSIGMWMGTERIKPIPDPSHYHADLIRKYLFYVFFYKNKWTIDYNIKNAIYLFEIY